MHGFRLRDGARNRLFELPTSPYTLAPKVVE